MQVTDEMIEAAWAAYQNTPIDLLADSDDETKRCVVNALTAALAAMWRPIESAPDDEEVLVCGFARDGYYVADAKKIDGDWMLFDQYSDDFTAASSGHTGWMPLPSPPKAEG